jgi:hypothetical protein
MDNAFKFLLLFYPRFSGLNHQHVQVNVAVLHRAPYEHRSPEVNSKSHD